MFLLMFSNACHTSHQMHVDRGPAAEGVALKIRRTPLGGQGVMELQIESAESEDSDRPAPCRRPLPKNKSK